MDIVIRTIVGVAAAAGLIACAALPGDRIPLAACLVAVLFIVIFAPRSE